MALVAAAGMVLATEPVAPKDLAKFYQDNCARCHGPTGNARDAAGKHLRGANFTDPKWQQGTNDTAAAKVVLNGIFFGLAMPSFKDKLSQDEARHLVRDVLHNQLGAKKP